MQPEGSTGIPAVDVPPLPILDLDLIDTVPGRLGLAVSGGSDSVALAVLLSEARPGRDVVILNVDHRLRAGSADDARFVEALGACLGRPVVTLAPPTPITGSLQAAAREARYGLLAGAARAHGLAAVATGHTRDDQAETLLLRLARGSGLRGLAAMRPRTVHHGLTILRPLLRACRDELRQALVARGIGWREDPSNADPRFDRVAMRNLAPRLAAVGLTSARLADAAAHLARASECIEALADELLARTARVDRAGAVRLARVPLFAAHDEIRLRTLARAVQMAGGQEHPPRFAALERTDTALRKGASATLGRARASVAGSDIVLWREARGIQPVLIGPGERGVFDGRWSVAVAADAPRLTVAAIGANLARSVPCEAHRPAVATAPGIFVGGELVSAPTFGVHRRGWPGRWVRVAMVR